MSVKYNVVWSLVFFLLGAAQALLAFLVLQGSGDFSVGLVVGPMLMLLSVLSVINPLYTLSGDELQARNLMGMTLKRNGFDRLKVETEGQPGEKRLYVVRKSGKAKRLMSTNSVMLQKNQVAALIGEIESRKAF